MISTRKATTLRERAHAKVTLSLRVTGTRSDGFHELDALTVAATDLYDEIRLAPARHRSTCTVTPKSAAPGGATNLAARAVIAIGPMLPPDAQTWRVNIAKRLPIGAGLGGGSADAAAVLRAFQRHYALRDRDVARAAATLGSDVPFCVRNRIAWMRGRGERVVPIDAVPAPFSLVVVTPSFECSTPAVYREWDAMGGPTAARAVRAPEAWHALTIEFANDLEPAAERVETRLVGFRAALTSVSGRDPILLGSGSSYAVVCTTAADANDAALAISAAMPEARLVATSAIR